ncbi:MAG: 2'-5' RNA ligase family protein [Clostridiaceae bacterium]|jgi:2'-5' RNA ligase|nr:2'-5' RNA ligase family protein [Clostridiaceae bacterium]
MTHAVTLRPSQGVRTQVRALWDALENAGVPLGFDRTLIEPHVTLSVVESDGPDPAEALLPLEAWCRRFAASLPRIPLHLPSLGLFTGTDEQGAVLYIAAASRGPLGEAFEAFRAGLPDGIRVSGYIYSPALWLPHITLALGLDPATLDRALSIATRQFRPVASDAEDLELYELMPVERVLRIALGPCDCGIDKKTCERCERIRYETDG